MEEKEYLSNHSLDTQEEDTGSSFDIRFWAMRLLRNWYLFVLSVGVALSIAYLQNKKWQPTYQTSARLMIEENRNRGLSQNLMQGFAVQSGFSNVNNQIVMLSSYDLIKTVVNKLPLTVESFRAGKFKTTDLYKKEPVKILPVEILPQGYGITYSIEEKDNDSFQIAWSHNNQEYTKQGKYDLPIKTHFFTIVCSKTDFYNPQYKFQFRFKSEQELINHFSRVAVNQFQNASSVVSISLEGKVPQRDIDFINELCQTFIEQNLDRKNEAAIRTINFIDQQLNEITDSINVSEGRLKSYRVNNQIIDVSSYTSHLVFDLKTIDEAKAAFRLKESYFAYLTDYLNKSISDEIIVVPASLGINDPTLIKLVGEFNDLQNKKREVGKLSPYYAQYTTNLDVIKTTLKEVMKGLNATMDLQRKDLQGKSSEVSSRIAQLPDQESRMNDYQRKYKINDNYYAYLLQKRAESQIQKASNSSDNVLLEEARVIAQTNSAEPGKTNTMCLIIGLLLPIGFLLAKDFLNDRVVTKKDIEKYSSYPYLGSIQHAKSSNPCFIQRNPRSALAESYRVIRTRTEFLTKKRSNIVMLVSSSESGDGKTAFCISMASMYALTGKKTILVDLDLRKPSVTNRLNLHVEKNKGVSNYLANQIDSVEDIIVKNAKCKFDILSGGSVPPNPGELVRSEKLRELFSQLSQMYDYVIVDTSPIGLVSDSYAMMHWTDINLFIVRSEKTRKMFFKNVIQQLKADKVPNINIVLNDVDEKKASYYSSYTEYGRKSYYMKNSDYEEYISKYFDETDDEHVPEKKAFKHRFKAAIKDLLSR